MNKKVDKIISLLENISEILKGSSTPTVNHNSMPLAYNIEHGTGFMVKVKKADISVQTQRSLHLIQRAISRLAQEKGIEFVEFHIPEFSKVLNSRLHHTTNFIANNYDKVKLIIEKIKRTKGNPMVLEFSSEENDLSNMLVNMLNQLKYELFFLRFELQQDTVKIWNEEFRAFITGNWLEIYTLIRLYKLIDADMAIAKSLKYQFYGNLYEVDVIVFDNLGNITLLLENKSSTNKTTAEKAVQQIREHARNLGIDFNRCFLVLTEEPSTEVQAVLNEQRFNVINFKRIDETLRTLLESSREVVQ